MLKRFVASISRRSAVLIFVNANILNESKRSVSGQCDLLLSNAPKPQVVANLLVEYSDNAEIGGS